MSEEVPEYYRPGYRPPLVPRPEAEIRATLILWQEHRRGLSKNAGYSPDYGAGVIAGLRWGLGDDAEAPITKAAFPQPPTLEQVGWQQSAADRLSKEHSQDQEQALPSGMGPSWFLGVEAALAWLRSAGDPRSSFNPEITTPEEFEDGVREHMAAAGLLDVG